MKHMIVKLLIGLLTVLFPIMSLTPALAADSLPAGLKPGKPYDGTQLTILLHPSKQNQAIKQRTAKFTEMTGIKVDYDITPYASLLEKITAESVAQTGTYDAFIINAVWAPSLANFVVPLDAYLKEAGIDPKRYPKAHLDMASYEGNIIGLPFRGHPQLLFYRKDALDKAGLNPPKTWKELEDMAPIVKEKTGLYAMAGYYTKGSAAQNLFPWYTLLWSNGGDIFDKDFNPIFNNAAGIEATERYASWIKKGVVPPGSLTYNEYEAIQSVAQGESAMVLVWWWVQAVLTNPKTAKAEVVDNIASAAAPGWEGKGKASCALLMPLCLASAGKNRDAAWEWMKWATDPSMEKEIVIDKSNPDTTTVVAVNYSTLNDPEVNKVSGGMHAAAAKSLQVAKILPVMPEWPEVANTLEIAINNIALGKPVKATMDKAAEEVAQIMKRSRGN